MTNLRPEICRELKEARRRMGLSQSAVALEVGCKQSALSMFEQGDGTKLNDEVIERLAKKFNVELKNSVGKNAVEPERCVTDFPAAKTIGFCPNPHCPTNHPYQVDGRTYFRPDRSVADPVGGKYCAMCGEILEKRCPSCGAPVHDGAICSLCGDSYVARI